ncbi:MAG: TraR/DksA C4-type zinc finger protein [Bacteroidales bacterium]|nr:TraR/DksA C4-type zinc finger protein [Bacteroidales bacterium]
MVMNAPDDKIMDISDVFEYQWNEPPHTFNGFVCEECGEMTVMEYGRIKGDKKVCIDCAAK